MDIAYFQTKFPEIEIAYNRVNWVGSDIQYFDFNKDTYCPLASRGQALMSPISKGISDRIEGLINGCTIVESECSLIFAKEQSRILVGFVRGSNYRIEGQEIEMESLSMISDLKEHSDIVWDEKDDFFDMSEDLHQLLGDE
jgi:hypothetical protein